MTTFAPGTMLVRRFKPQEAFQALGKLTDGRLVVVDARGWVRWASEDKYRPMRSLAQIQTELSKFRRSPLASSPSLDELEGYVAAQGMERCLCPNGPFRPGQKVDSKGLGIGVGVVVACLCDGKTVVEYDGAIAVTNDDLLTEHVEPMTMNELADNIVNAMYAAAPFAIEGPLTPEDRVLMVATVVAELGKAEKRGMA